MKQVETNTLRNKLIEMAAALPTPKNWESTEEYAECEQISAAYLRVAKVSVSPLDVYCAYYGDTPKGVKMSNREFDATVARVNYADLKLATPKALAQAESLARRVPLIQYLLGIGPEKVGGVSLKAIADIGKSPKFAPKGPVKKTVRSAWTTAKVQDPVLRKFVECLIRNGFDITNGDSEGFIFPKGGGSEAGLLAAMKECGWQKQDMPFPENVEDLGWTYYIQKGKSPTSPLWAVCPQVGMIYTS